MAIFSFTAGADAVPRSDIPIASFTVAMVLAVNMPPQEPCDKDRGIEGERDRGGEGWGERDRGGEIQAEAEGEEGEGEGEGEKRSSSNEKVRVKYDSSFVSS